MCENNLFKFVQLNIMTILKYKEQKYIYFSQLFLKIYTRKNFDKHMEIS